MVEMRALRGVTLVVVLLQMAMMLCEAHTMGYNATEDPENCTVTSGNCSTDMPQKTSVHWAVWTHESRVYQAKDGGLILLSNDHPQFEYFDLTILYRRNRESFMTFRKERASPWGDRQIVDLADGQLTFFVNTTGSIKDGSRFEMRVYNAGKVSQGIADVARNISYGTLAQWESPWNPGLTGFQAVAPSRDEQDILGRPLTYVVMETPLSTEEASTYRLTIFELPPNGGRGLPTLEHDFTLGDPVFYAENGIGLTYTEENKIVFLVPGLTTDKNYTFSMLAVSDRLKVLADVRRELHEPLRIDLMQSPLPGIRTCNIFKGRSCDGLEILNEPLWPLVTLPTSQKKRKCRQWRDALRCALQPLHAVGCPHNNNTLVALKMQQNFVRYACGKEGPALLCIKSFRKATRIYNGCFANLSSALISLSGPCSNKAFDNFRDCFVRQSRYAGCSITETFYLKNLADSYYKPYSDALGCTWRWMY